MKSASEEQTKKKYNENRTLRVNNRVKKVLRVASLYEIYYAFLLNSEELEIYRTFSHEELVKKAKDFVQKYYTINLDDDIAEKFVLSRLSTLKFHLCDYDVENKVYNTYAYS